MARISERAPLCTPSLHLGQRLLTSRAQYSGTGPPIRAAPFVTGFAAYTAAHLRTHPAHSQVGAPTVRPSRDRGRSSESGAARGGERSGATPPRTREVDRLPPRRPLLGAPRAELPWLPEARCAFEWMLRQRPHRARAVQAEQDAVAAQAAQLRSEPHATQPPMYALVQDTVHRGRFSPESVDIAEARATMRGGLRFCSGTRERQDRKPSAGGRAREAARAYGVCPGAPGGDQRGAGRRLVARALKSTPARAEKKSMSETGLRRAGRASSVSEE